MSGWWTKYPLPEGWEIKYHWESKRFLYIDHANKTTAWVDPRIELYKRTEEGKLEQVREDNDGSSSERSSEDSTAVQRNKIIGRENKAKNIHKKYPEFSLEKIMTLLESNYDNEFSVESKLGQEHRNIMELEETKKKEAETREKAAAAEREKRAKEEAIRRQEEVKRKAEEDSRRLEAERRNRAMEEAKRIEAENKRHADELERKRLRDEANILLEREKTLQAEIDQLTKKTDEKAKESVNHQLPKYGNHVEGCSKQPVNPCSNSKKAVTSSVQKGPNRSLFSGSDPSNYKGANSDLLSNRGRSLAKGPDPSNWCGPQVRSSVTST